MLARLHNRGIVGLQFKDNVLISLKGNIEVEHFEGTHMALSEQEFHDDIKRLNEYVVSLLLGNASKKEYEKGARLVLLDPKAKPVTKNLYDLFLYWMGSLYSSFYGKNLSASEIVQFLKNKVN